MPIEIKYDVLKSKKREREHQQQKDISIQELRPSLEQYERELNELVLEQIVLQKDIFGIQQDNTRTEVERQAEAEAKKMQLNESENKG